MKPTLLVGDYLFDLQVGRAAGTARGFGCAYAARRSATGATGNTDRTFAPLCAYRGCGKTVTVKVGITSICAGAATGTDLDGDGAIESR